MPRLQPGQGQPDGGRVRLPTGAGQGPAQGRRRSQRDAFSAAARAREAGVAHRHLKRRAHALEPGALRSPQNARAGRALRGKSGRGRCGQAQKTVITAMGRGRYGRTNIDKCGFPRGYLRREKQVRGIKTGDRVEAVVPAGFAACGTHTGRIAVRGNGQFRMGKVQGIPARFCRMLQRADGYDYARA